MIQIYEKTQVMVRMGFEIEIYKYCKAMLQKIGSKGQKGYGLACFVLVPVWCLSQLIVDCSDTQILSFHSKDD